MTDRLIKFIGHEFFTAGWRVFILVILIMAGWTWNRQIDRIDTHDAKIQDLQQFMANEFVKKDELCELKSDVKSIQKTLNTTMPEISRFMGQTAEYMRTDGGRK